MMVAKTRLVVKCGWIPIYFVLKVESTGFADGLDMEWERGK